MIPYSKQHISKKDITAVTKALQSEFITQGPVNINFEKAISSKFNSKYCFSMNSASSALHAACLALGLTKGDILWTVPNTFVASANCGINCGAKIDFVDIDNLTYNMDCNLLERKLIKAKKENKVPKIIIPVHFSGQPTDQERIFHLSRKYKFKIIEDASHSIGSKRNDENIGSCRWSHITVFSFHPVKIITSGEGGMVLTNIKSIANNIERIRTNGITKTKSKLKNKNVGPWYYEQQIQGFNFRMTELQAALGLSQLKSIDKFVTKRNLIAKRYIKLLKDLPIQLPTVKDGNYSSFHLYVIRLKLDKLKKNYKTVFNELRKHKINVNLHYLPIHLHPFYKQMGFKKGDFPVSEMYAKEAISIPIYFDLTFDKQKYVAKILKRILK